MDLVNILVALGVGTGEEAYLQVFFGLLGLFFTFLATYFVFYVLACILIWPRLVAKSRFPGKRNLKKMRRLKRLLLTAQLLLFLVTIVISWLVVPDLYINVFMIAVLMSSTFFCIWIVIRVVWHIPLLNAFIFQNKPPDFFIREIGRLWLNPLSHFLTTLILFLVIASHIVGFLMFAAGFIFAIVLKKYIPRQEDSEKKSYYREMKETSKYGSKKYLLGELMAEEI